MTAKKETPVLDTIINLCLLAEEYGRISTKNHLKFLSNVIKEDHQQRKSAIQTLATLYNCDLGITVSRLAYRMSNFYDKIPENLMPRFMGRNSIFGESTMALNQMYKMYKIRS